MMISQLRPGAGLRRPIQRRASRSAAPALGALIAVVAAFGTGASARAATDGAASPFIAAACSPTGLQGVSCFDVAVSERSVHLLFGTPGDSEGDGLAFYATRSTDGGRSWAEPVRLPTDHAPPGRLHRGNDPQLAVRGERMMALWTAQGEGPYGSGPLATALSNDGGATWRPGPGLGGDDLSAGFRFPAIAADDRAFHVIWIHAAGEERSLRAARLDFGAEKWSEALVIDPDCCACCWNELKSTPDGALVALYRDEEPKDMMMAVSGDGGRTWRQTGHAGRFDWTFDGCPHVGGGLAVASDAVWATVWTGEAETAGAYVLRSTDRGETWSAPARLGVDGGTGRNTDIGALSPDRVFAAWDQSIDGEQAVYLAYTADRGRTWSRGRRLSAPGRQASHPRLAVVDGSCVALWTEYVKDEPPRLRIEAINEP